MKHATEQFGRLAMICLAMALTGCGGSEPQSQEEEPEAVVLTEENLDELDKAHPGPTEDDEILSGEEPAFTRGDRTERFERYVLHEHGVHFDRPRGWTVLAIGAESEDFAVMMMLDDDAMCTLGRMPHGSTLAGMRDYAVREMEKIIKGKARITRNEPIIFRKRRAYVLELEANGGGDRNFAHMLVFRLDRRTYVTGFAGSSDQWRKRQDDFYATARSVETGDIRDEVGSTTGSSGLRRAQEACVVEDGPGSYRTVTCTQVGLTCRVPRGWSINDRGIDEDDSLIVMFDLDEDEAEVSVLAVLNVRPAESARAAERAHDSYMRILGEDRRTEWQEKGLVEIGGRDAYVAKGITGGHYVYYVHTMSDDETRLVHFYLEAAISDDIWNRVLPQLETFVEHLEVKGKS